LVEKSGFGSFEPSQPELVKPSRLDLFMLNHLD